MSDVTKGTVKWFDTARGFGFIKLREGKDLFVHYSGIKPTGKERRILEEGQTVEFRVVDGRKGPNAVDVQVLATDSCKKK